MLKLIFFTMLAVIMAIGFAPAFSTTAIDTTPYTSAPQHNTTAVSVRTTCVTGDDTDSDGICDSWESNTGPNPGLHIDFIDTTIGTGPVEYKYDLGCDPAATIDTDHSGYTVCPRPGVKDIYLEIDWMHNQDVTDQAIWDVVKAYNRTGISLHIQRGEQPSGTGSARGDIGVNYCVVRRIASGNGAGPVTNCGSVTQPGTVYQNYPYLKQTFFGTQSERGGDNTICPLNVVPSTYTGTGPGMITVDSEKRAFNCLTAKRQVFHYGMAVEYLWGTPSASGWSEIVGNDIVISMGSFTGGIGNNDQQEASIMHELGHNLGLDHGGFGDSLNCKPNYLSVMNYLYQFRNNDPCRPLAYSNATLATLNEALTSSTLKDTNIGTYQYPSYNPLQGPDGQTMPGGGNCPTSGERTIFWTKSPSTLTGKTGAPGDDWNNNGMSSTQTYSQILNNFGGSSCTYTSPTTLNGFNDTNFLLHGSTADMTPLIFRGSPNFYSGTPSGLGDDKEVGPGDGHEDSPVTVITQDFSLSTFPNGLAIDKGSSGTTTISLTPLNGYSSTASLSISGAPAGVTTSFSSSSITSTTSPVLTINVDSSTVPNTYTLTLTATDGTTTHDTPILLTVHQPAVPPNNDLLLYIIIGLIVIVLIIVIIILIRL